jgi:PAS domain-containing protein
MSAPEKRRSAFLHKRLKKTPGISSIQLNEMTSEDVQRLVRGLQLHQIELEAQNEELRAVQVGLAQSRERYVDLFEFAPIAYLTLDKNGRILETNLAAHAMLGCDRRDLLSASLAKFIRPEYQEAWHLCLRAAFKTR